MRTIVLRVVCSLLSVVCPSIYAHAGVVGCQSAIWDPDACRPMITAFKKDPYPYLAQIAKTVSAASIAIQSGATRGLATLERQGLGCSLVSKSGVAGDDKQRLEMRQGGDDVLYDPISKVLLLWIARHVLEGQHGNRRLVWERERRAVFVLWTRLRRSRGFSTMPRMWTPNSIQSHRALNILQRFLAEVIKRELGLASDLLEGAGGHANAPGLTFGLNTSGNIHPVAEDVIPVNDNVADVYADTIADLSSDRSVTFLHLTLHDHGASHSVNSTGKLDEHAVAGSFDDAAPEARDGIVDQFAAMCFQGLQGANLICSHKP